MTTRYEFLKLLSTKITDELIVSTVAGATVEWAHLKPRDGNLYMCWMSGSASMALGLALALPHRRVISLDGDGSCLMGLAGLPSIAYQNPSNFIDIVFDNEAYEACSNVSTFTSGRTDLVKIAKGAGIPNTWLVRGLEEFEKVIGEAFDADGASFIQVKVQLPSPPVPRSAVNLVENKFRFVRYVENTENIQIIKGPKKFGRE